MILKGKKLHFISQVSRDGTGVVLINKDEAVNFKNDLFKVLRLSISQRTYIAIGFNTYVVKLKNNQQ